MKRGWQLVALSMIGCGGDSEPVTVHAAGSTLVAARLDGGSWQALAVDANGDAKVDADGPFAVAIVCERGNVFQYRTTYAGPSVAELDMRCAREGTVSVRIETMSPTTTVHVGGSTGLTDGDIAEITRGTHDVFALDTADSPPHFELRRDVALDTDTTISFDDLRGTDLMMNLTSIEVPGVSSSEVIQRHARLNTANSLVRSYPLPGSSEVPVFPAQALVETDRQHVEVALRDGTGYRMASKRIRGDETNVTVTLPGSLAPATTSLGEEITASWDNDQGFTKAWLYVNDMANEVSWTAFAHESYRDAGGPLVPVRIPDPRQLPGWNTAWTLPSAGDLRWQLTVMRGDEDTTASVSQTGSF